MLPMAGLDPIKSFLSNLAPYLILVYSIIVNYKIWYHSLITHYHILWILALVESSLKRQCHINMIPWSVVRQKQWWYMPRTQNWEAPSCPSIRYNIRLVVFMVGTHNILFVRCYWCSKTIIHWNCWIRRWLARETKVPFCWQLPAVKLINGCQNSLVFLTYHRVYVIPKGIYLERPWLPKFCWTNLICAYRKYLILVGWSF